MTDEPNFPEPVYFGKKRHWRLSALVKYEATLASEEYTSLPESSERYLTAAQVKERYGVSDMWLWRRLNPDRAYTTAIVYGDTEQGGKAND